MKKLFTLTFLLLGLSSLSVTAQTLHYGIKAGYNAANIGGDVQDTKSLSAFHVGFLFEVELTDKFSIQPEILYSAQGAKYGSGRKTTIDYVNVPILAKYYFIDGLSVEAGPQIGFLTKSEDKWDGETIDYKDETKGIDFSIPVGLSYRFPINVFVSARYVFGISNFNDLDDSNYKMNHQVFQASLGYRF
jgi:hypothetical protein